MVSGTEGLIFRRMLLADVEAVWAVEQASFPTPWTADAFRYELSENACALYWVVEVAGRIVGYAGAWFVQDQATMTNIAVAPDSRGLGIGVRLMSGVLEAARAAGIVQFSLEVRVSNLVAQGLYRKFGFQDGGIRKRYYPDNYEDALVMWVML